MQASKGTSEKEIDGFKDLDWSKWLSWLVRDISLKMKWMIY